MLALLLILLVVLDMNEFDADIIIIGGGVVGLCAALAFERRDYSVIVLDARDFEVVPENSRVYALNQTSQDLLVHLGVWENLEHSQVTTYQGMHIWDALNKESLDFDARMVGQPSLGVMIDEATLKSALYKTLSTSGVQLMAHSSVESVDFIIGGVKIGTKNKFWLSKWIIVADGSQSSICKLLDLPIYSWPYNQHAITARVSIELPHKKMAYQVFHPEGPLALLPLASKHECAVVWSADALNTQQRMNLSQQEFNLSLQKALESIVGKCELISERRSHPLVMRYALQYFGQRWVVMGDAAHTIHPLAGLGLNLGLADLITLMQLLPKTKDVDWSNALLGKYQRNRKYMVGQMVVCMEILKRLFSTASLPIVCSRGFGLKICQNVVFLKHLFIEKASGR